MRPSLRTTTALLASLALVVPTVVPAQTGNAAGDKVSTCAADDPNCDPNAVAKDLADKLKEKADAADPSAKANREAEKAAKQQAREAEKAAKQQAREAEKAARQEARKAEKAQADADAKAAAQADADADAKAVKQQADADAKAAQDADARKAAKAQADADAKAAEAVKQQADADAKAAQDAEVRKSRKAEREAREAAEAKAAADARTETQANVGAKAKAEADARAAADAAVTNQDATDPARKAPRRAERNADGTAAATTTAQDGDPAAATTQQDDPAAQTTDANQRETPEERAARLAAREQRLKEGEARRAAQAERLAQQAERAKASQAATADGDAAANAKVTEETVTEANSRSSNEDFSGQIKADTNPEVTATAQAPEKDDGLSKLEKALLLGAGALAIGTMIQGNRQVVGTSPDRVVVADPNGGYQLLKDDNALLRQPGNNIQTQTFDDGSTRTVVTREDGSQVVTIRDNDMRVLRRTLVRTDGSEVRLIDDTATVEPVDFSALPQPAPQVEYSSNERDLRAALEREQAINRRFSLAQIRDIKEVRNLAPAVELDGINFATGSAAIRPEEANKLADLGLQITRMIEEDPSEVFLVEGHTDAVGSAASNLILSDRRAESLALALTEYFDVPPENLVVQGYGESDLKVPTEGAEPANRRADLRRITPLLQTAQN